MASDPGTPSWSASSEEPEVGSPLDGDTSCDLAIVGGGYTGLSTALHGSARGLSCHVLEAEGIGHGGSGRNVGLVNAGMWLPPDEVCRRIGTERGRALVDLLGRMPDEVFGLIEEHGIRCEAVRSGTIHAAHSPRGLRELQARADGWRDFGAEVELLSAAEAREFTGSGRFHGGLLDRRAGTINPMGYARGLARAARAGGARISTQTPVTGLALEGDGWRLDTPRGTVAARSVVLATNAYAGTLWPGLSHSYTPIHFVQVATEPLAGRAGHVLPGGQGLWDTAPVMTSLRRDAAGRIILGCMGAVMGIGAELTRRWAARHLQRLYPDLGPVSLEDAWHGTIAFTPDHLFRIHRLAEGLYAPVGYNGRGIITGTLFGRALAERLTGASDDCLPVPVTDLKPVPARSLRAGFYRAAFAISQLARSL